MMTFIFIAAMLAVGFPLYWPPQKNKNHFKPPALKYPQKPLSFSQKFSHLQDTSSEGGFPSP